MKDMTLEDTLPNFQLQISMKKHVYIVKHFRSLDNEYKHDAVFTLENTLKYIYEDSWQSTLLLFLTFTSLMKQIKNLDAEKYWHGMVSEITIQRKLIRRKL